MLRLPQPFRFAGSALLLLLAVSVPALATWSDTAPTSSELAETMECRFSDDMRELAASLDHDPIRIFRYVTEEIEYQHYAYSRKGAVGTHFTGKGNTWDQCSLLVTLLRLSGIPARYATFTVSGGYEGVVVRAWLPERLLAGNLTGLAGKKCWVSLVPWMGNSPIDLYYGSSQSLISMSFSTAVPLAETTVRHELFWDEQSSQTSIPSDLNFSDFDNQMAFLARSDTKGAVEVFEEACADHLTKNNPSWSLDDILPKTYRQQLPDDSLPLALPPQLGNSSQASEYTDIPDSFRASAALTITKDDNAGSASIDLKLPRLVDRRLTLDWIETATDTLQPVLRLDGEALSFTGTVPSFAKSATLTDTYTLSYQPREDLNATERPSHDAGTLVFFNFDLYSASEQTARRLRREIAALDPADAVATAASAWEAREAFVGRVGSLLANTYYMRWRGSLERAYSLHAVRHEPGTPSSFLQIYVNPDTLAADESGLTPFGILAAWNIDTCLGASDGARIMDQTATPLDWSSDLSRNIRNLYMFDSSGNEAWNFEDWQGTPSLSTVDGIRQALHNGLPILRIQKVGTDSYTVDARKLDSGAVVTDTAHAGTFTESTINGWLTTKYSATDEEYTAGRASYLFGQVLNNTAIQITLPINRVVFSYLGVSGATTTMKADLWIRRDTSPSCTAGGDGYMFSMDPLTIEQGGGSAWDLADVLDHADEYQSQDAFFSAMDTFLKKEIASSDNWWKHQDPNYVNAAIHTDGDPVSLCSGEFVAEEMPDLQLPSAGFALTLMRRYGSQIGYDGPFGCGWGWSHSERILQTIHLSGDGYATGSYDILYLDAQRSCHTIRLLPSGEWELPPGANFRFDKLADDTYRIYRRDLVTLTFDSDGHLTQKEDRNGNTLTISRNASGEPTAISDDFGQSLTFTYGAVSGKVETVTDNAGRTVYYLYGVDPVDANDDPLANYFTEHSVPATIQDAINAGLADHATTALPNPTLADLGAPNDLVAFVNADGQVTTYTYLQGYPSDSFLNHNMARCTLPNGEYLELEYQQNDTVSQHRNSKGDVFSFRYSFLNHHAETWNEEGWYRKVIWNENMDVVRASEKDRTFVRNVYDDKHRLLATTDGDGCTKLFTYDDRNNLASTQILDRPTDGATVWTVFNHDTETIETSGGTAYTLAQYASMSRASRLALGAEYTEMDKTYGGTSGADFFRPTGGTVTDPLGETTTSSYDACGRLESVQLPAVAGRIVRSLNTYTAYGQLATAKRQVSTDGGTSFSDVPATLTTNTYSSTYPFRLASTADGYGATASITDYDDAGRPVSVRDPAGFYTHTSYTGIGLPWRRTLPSDESVDDGTLPAVESRYDSLARRTAVIGPDGATVATVYAPIRDIVKRADPAEVIDALGYTESFEYDAVGNVVSRTDQNGETWTFTHDGMGRILATVAPDGTTRYNTWNGRGQLSSSTDPLGNTTLYGYDAAGRPAWETDPAANTTERVYDAVGRLAASVPPGGAVTLMGYDARSRLVTRTLLDDADGDLEADAGEEARTTTFSYDDRDRLVQQVDPLGHYTRYVYDLAAEATPAIDTGSGESDPDGRAFALPADATPRNTAVLRFQKTGASTWELLSQSVSLFDERGLLICSIDPLGDATEYEYDAERKLVAVTNPMGTMTQHEYDVAGHRVATRVFSPAPISALRSETRWSYNLRGEQTAEIRAVLDEDGVEVGSVARSFLTDPAGRQVATIDEEGQEWRTVRDALGRSVAEMDPLGHASIISRDANGSPSSIADPLDNIVDYYYDVRGLRIRTVDQQMYEFGQTYDERGLPTSQTCEPTEPTDPLIVDTTAYNAFGEVSSTTAASGVGGTVESTVAYTRDAIGQVTAVAAAQDSGGTQVHAVSYDYDGAGNVVTETDTDSTHAEYFYDAAGNLRLEVKRDGSIVARLRDPLGQVTDVYTFPDATDPATLSTDAAVQTGTLRQHFVYDDLGRLVSATDYNDTGTGDDHTVNFVYSSLGEPIQEEHVFANGAASYTLTVGYDKRSAPVSLSYPSGAIATITRDERGLPVAFDYDPGAGTAITVAMCGYDAAGRLSDAAFGNGLAMARDFDARSLELGRTYADGANIVLNVTTGTVASTYDSRGNPLGETVAGAIAASAQTARTFAYDERDRLAAQDGAGSEDDASWTLDKLGNWTSVTEAGVTENRTVSLDNEYTVIDAGAVTNDANGNLTVHAGLTFSYDWANRLVEVLDGTVALASYTYDALGRRVSRTTGGTTTRYIHSGSQVIEEYEDSGPGFSLARRYVLGPGLDQPILMDDAGATTDGPYYYLRNRQGSVLALTDVDGDVVESYTYSAYGSMRLFDNTGTEITTSVSLLGNPYGYTGRRFDTEAGLLYYRNRYYSPELGRFLTRDPAGHVDGMNLYAYVRGNPLAYIDPWGLQAMGSSDGWTPAPLEGYYPPESLFSTPATTYQQQYLAAHADPDPQQSVSFWEQAKMGMGTAWEAAKAAPGYAYDYGSSAYCAWANANTLGAVQWTAEKLSGNDADLYYRYRASDAERSGAVFGTKLALLQTAVEGVVGTTMAVMGKGTTVVGVLMNVVPGVGNAASLPTVVAGASATTAGLAIDAHAGLVGTKAYDQLQQLNAMTGSGSSGGSAGSAPKNSLPSNEGQMKHIFREAEGHIADTPTNRQLLLDVADDTATTLGTDRFGNTWSARTLEDGSQVWVQTRNGVVQNGGINAVPKQFNPKTGLSGGGG